MRINDEFEAKPVQMVALYRNGDPIRDEHGRVQLYNSWDAACHVAANWERFRAPTFGELRNMSDDDLIERIERALLEP